MKLWNISNPKEDSSKDIPYPFLFLLCSKGLSSLLIIDEEMKQIQGLKTSRSGPSISHLFFIDDAFIFCKAFPNKVRMVRSIFNWYRAT